MKITFRCPICEAPASWSTSATAWRCLQCDHVIKPVEATQPLDQCAICGNRELYNKKDFPQWLGMTILVCACILFVSAHALYHQWLAWGILIGSAIFDGVLYLWVGDAVVCYRCGTQYSRLKPPIEHKPFELMIAERYRQENLRMKEAQLGKRGPPV